MEWHVVLAHKLIQLYIFRILPPLLPLRCVARSNRNISDRCIKPDIKNLSTARKNNNSIWWNLREKIWRGQHKFSMFIYQTPITLSLNPSCGTGTPHFRSLVIHLDFSPSLSQAVVAWIAFWLQDPSTDIFLIYSSNLSFSKGSSRNKWFVSRMRGVVWQTCLQIKLMDQLQEMYSKTKWHNIMTLPHIYQQ